VSQKSLVLRIQTALQICAAKKVLELAIAKTVKVTQAALVTTVQREVLQTMTTMAVMLMFALLLSESAFTQILVLETSVWMVNVTNVSMVQHRKSTTVKMLQLKKNLHHQIAKKRKWMAKTCTFALSQTNQLRTPQKKMMMVSVE
jgi:chromate transport protein ChrA